ncbi:MAG: lamin tail domain-containing protein [Proteobacteria bacterium]|nr:lamin tail domain-containing protein [Burkholderiales bacterium]
MSKAPAHTLNILVTVAALAGALIAGPAAAQLRITEWMYNGSGAGDRNEYVELTNFGPTAIDLTGFSFDDISRSPGAQSLSAFGSIASGQSVIFTEAAEGVFRTEWSLAPTVKVVGGNTNNLGRSDEINIYGAGPLFALIDALTYNDQGAGNVAGPRTQNVSGRARSAAAFGANNASLWVLSSIGDVEGSYASVGGNIGSPGFTSFFVPATTVVPVPGAALLMLGGLGVLGFAGRRHSQTR